MERIRTIGYGSESNLSYLKRAYSSETVEDVVKKKNTCDRTGACAKLLIPCMSSGIILGKGGGTIVTLQEAWNCRIHLSKGNQYYPGTTDRVCVITTTAVDDLKEAFATIIRMILKVDPNEKVQVKLLVPNQIAGLIIGKEGATIKNLQEEYDINIQLSKKVDHLVERTVTLSGFLDAVICGGCKILDALSTNVAMLDHRNVVYPVTASTGSSSVTPALMPSCATALPLPEHLTKSSPRLSAFNFKFSLDGTGVACTIPPTMLDTLMMSLRAEGYPEYAVSEITSAMTILAKYGIVTGGQYPVTYFTNGTEPGNSIKTKEEIYIPDMKIGAILGAGGKTLDEIQRSSGTYIQISKKGEFVSGTTDRTVNIVGTNCGIEYAKRIIYHKIQEADTQRAARVSTSRNIIQI